MPWVRAVASAALLLSLFSAAVVAAPSERECDRDEAACAGQWRSAGQNIANTRSQPAEERINAANVGRLTPRWTFITNPSVTTSPTSDVSATPTVAGHTV